ncbi:MAG TPA: AAA family ATPase [Solirubrobacteraceae bacterium]|nr:AAA family ATPase [Solirubrobacteraceae bacterium]
MKFDVRGVKPPFSLRDPHAEGMRPVQNGRKRKRVELPPEQERYRLYTVDELGEFEPVSWLIDEHLAVGELTGLYGKGGTYKSFLALDWSCLLAHEGATVVYIVAEGASGMRARIEAWKRAHNVGNLPSLWLMPSNVKLHGEEYVTAWIEAMRTQLGSNAPDLVVVDTLARNFVGGSENNPQEMGLFVDGCERIRQAFATALLILHHTTKEGDSERGTESLRNASFAMFKMTQTGGSGRAVKLECDRMKDAEQPEARILHPKKYELPELGEDISSLVSGWSHLPPTPMGAKDPQRGKTRGELSTVQRKALRTLVGANEGANGGVSRAVVARAFGVDPKHVARTTKPLVDMGYLEVAGTTKSRRYMVTKEGREAL